MNIEKITAFIGAFGKLYKTALEAQISFDSLEIDEKVSKLPNGYALGASKNPREWAVFFDYIANRQEEAKKIDEQTIKKQK